MCAERIFPALFWQPTRTYAERRLGQSQKALAFVQGKKTPPTAPRLPLASTTVPADKRLTG